MLPNNEISLTTGKKIYLFNYLRFTYLIPVGGIKPAHI